MRVLASEILTAIDAMSQPGVWAHLYDIKIDSVTTLYKTDGPISVTYNSNVYSPYPIVMENIDQTSKPENKTFTISVANIDHVLAAYLEAGKIMGNDLIITWVFLRKVDDSIVTAFSEKYQILSAEIDDDKAAATFQVGKYNLFIAQLPSNRWIDFRCNRVYRSIDDCNYGRDEFLDISQIDLKQGGDGYKKIQGWYALNTANCALADINITNPDNLTVNIGTATNCNWNQTTKTGPFIYRKLLCNDVLNVNPDFDIQARFVGNPNEVQETEGLFICTDLDAPNDWIFIAQRVLSGTSPSMVVMKNNAGTETTEYSNATNQPIVRIAKSGNQFTCYNQADGSSTWNQLAQFNHGNLNGVITRVGLAFGTGSSGRASTFAGRVDWFRMTSGGYYSCDRSIEACRLRENIRRIGSAPGLIHGSLNL